MHPVASFSSSSLECVQHSCARCLSVGGVFVLVASSPGLAAQRKALSLNDEDRERVARYTRSSDRENFLAGRHLLARLAFGGCSLKSLRISPAGKPMPERGVHFNLSHSGRMVAVALTRTGPLGVDIEACAGFQRFAAVVDRFSHPQENAYVLATKDSHAALLRRLEVWTRKESVVKATGRGMAFDVNGWSTICHATAAEPSNVAGYELCSFIDTNSTWVLSVAHQSSRAPTLRLLEPLSDQGDTVCEAERCSA